MVTSVETGAARVARFGEAGNYIVLSLPVGPHGVRAEKAPPVALLPFSEVNAVLLVIAAEAFENVGVGQQVVRHLDGKGPGVHLWIIEGHFDIHVAEVTAAVPLRDT